MSSTAAISQTSIPTTRSRFDWLTALSDKPWFAYATILLLQLHRMWRIWDGRDMAGGDTCAYFLDAYSWFRHRHNNFAFSPIYTVFWSRLLHLTDDVAVAWLLHRVIIVLAVTALVLAVFRKLLPRNLAWLAAVWWAVLPINFDTSYEVHLFALLPILLAWLALLPRAGSAPNALGGAWRRGVAIALMVVSAFLVRNEMIVSVLCLAGLCVIREIRARRLAARQPLLNLTAAYGIPVLAALALVLYFYQRSEFRGDALRHQFYSKHVASIGQAYALGYLERHPDWGRNPWSDFEDANQRDFGMPLPTLSQMLRQNPGAVIKHCMWNLRLVPAAAQLLLFNQISGGMNSDVVPQLLHSKLALALSILTTVVVLAALWKRLGGGVGGRRSADALWSWLAMLAVVSFCMPVILLLRPRPAYLYSVSLLLMAAISTCIYLLAVGWSHWRWVAPPMPILMIALPLCVPSAYGARTGQRPQILWEDYERLRPYEKFFNRTNAIFVGACAVEMCNYIGHGRCQPHDYSTLNELTANAILAQFLNDRHVTLLELDQDALDKIDSLSPGAVGQFLEAGSSDGWRVLEIRRLGRGWWMLFARSPQPPPLDIRGIIGNFGTDRVINPHRAAR